MGLDSVSRVKIDNGDHQHYIVAIVENGDRYSRNRKLVLRSKRNYDYHEDVYYELIEELGSGLLAGCIGGGYLNVDSDKRRIHVYSSSGQFGYDDRLVTAHLLQDAFPGWKITWEDADK